MAANDVKLAWQSSLFELREGANLIGRKDADITIPEKSLSKEHARVIRTGPIFEIEDAGSKNGTLLNDRPVAGRMSIGPGDVIKLGGRVEIRVVGDGVAAAPDPAAPVSARARFTVLVGDNKGKVLSLSNEKPFTIGSKEENALSLKGEGISRYHAEVGFENGAWLLKDLGSRNGTYVAGRKVDLHELATGDEVQVGSIYIRFEALDARGPLALPAGPKELVKNPKVRQAVMLAISAAAILFYVSRGGTPGPPPPTTAVAETSKNVHDAIQLLDREDSARAHDLITRALHAREGQSNPTLLALDTLAKIWEEHRSPITFEWSGAADAIDKLVRGSGPQDMDQDCLDWLQRMRKGCQTEAPNATRRTQADAAMGKGQNALRNGQVKEGFDALEEALGLYRGMPPTSVFADNARKRAEEIRKILMRTHVLEAEKFVAGDRTGWDAAMKEFAVARRYAETLDERKPIDDRSGWCELNQRDEKALQDAENIVKNGEEKRYGEAKTLLEGISPNGRYGKQAQDALEWFQADDLVRAAINAYHSGNWEEACTLVDKAVSTPDLNPQAVEQVKRRRAHWESVHDAWAKGAAAEQSGDFKGARELYKFVVANEPWSKNVYRTRAVDGIATIDARDQAEIEGAVKLGIDLLEAGKLRNAYDKFAFVAERVPEDSPARARIEDAVARVNKAKNTFKEANRLVVTNKKDRFGWVKDALDVLSRFLPASDPDRDAAAQLLPKVK